MPPEITDLIMSKLAEINIKFVEKSKVICKYYNEIIFNRRDIFFLLEFCREIGEVSEGFFCHIKSQLNITYSDDNFERISYTHQDVQSQFEKACIMGNLEYVKWMVRTFNIEIDDTCIFIVTTLTDTSRNGHYETLKWLVEKFNLIEREKVELNGIIFIYKLMYGTEYLNIIKYLTEVLNITEKEIKSNENTILQISCEGGSLKVIKWLINTFNFTIEDIKSLDYEALKCAYMRGNIEVVKWLIDTFKLTVSIGHN